MIVGKTVQNIPARLLPLSVEDLDLVLKPEAVASNSYSAVAVAITVGSNNGTSRMVQNLASDAAYSYDEAAIQTWIVPGIVP